MLTPVESDSHASDAIDDAIVPARHRGVVLLVLVFLGVLS